MLIRANLLRLGDAPGEGPKDAADSFKLDGSKLVMGKQIGKGSYGVVYRADLAGTPVAVKKFMELKGHDPEEFKEEIELMKMLRHPNFVTYLGVVDIPGEKSLSYVTELCDADLRVVCRNIRDKDPSKFLTKACRYFCQAARGLCYLHDVCHMIHRDIKPANILVKKDEVKIGDFGFTLMNFDDEDFSEDHRGTTMYKAPELFSLAKYSYPVDVYAFSISMFEVLVGSDPFLGHSEKKEFGRAVCRGERPDINRLAKAGLTCPPSLINLMTRCWDANPAKRPLMGEVYKELKKIFIETIVPASGAGFKFWHKHFGENITDSVTLNDIVKVLPDGLSESWRDLLQCSDLVAPISVKDVDNAFNWYGDLMDKDHLVILYRKIRDCTWFKRKMDRDKAAACTSDYHLQTGKGCFLVRTSETNSRMNPFTITICKRSGAVDHCRVFFNEAGKVGSLKFVDSDKKIIFASDIFELIDKYIALGLLTEDPLPPGFKLGDYE